MVSWDAIKKARLAYLLGAGHTFDEIILDAEFAGATSNMALRSEAHRLCLSERHINCVAIPRISSKFRELDPAAKRRGITRAMLIERILNELADDPSLVDAVLDDLQPEKPKALHIELRPRTSAIKPSLLGK